MIGTGPIVVGIDGSEASDRAVIWATHTACSTGRGVHIVTAVDAPPFLDDEQRQEFLAIADARVAAAVVLAEETRAGDPAEITSETAVGSVSEVLLEFSRRADTVVLGSRGLGDSSADLVGSATLALAAHAFCPVAVVRGRTLDGRPPEQGPIVVGVDGSAVNQVAVGRAFEEASSRGSALIAVHVWSDVNLARVVGIVPEDWTAIAANEELVLAESLAGWQEKFPDVEVRRVVAQDRPVRVIAGLSEQAALIVVGNRGRGGFTGMLLGSTSFALIHTADCPVLVVRDAT